MKTDYDFIIIGAGPVGLLLANLLGQRGQSVLVAEKRTALPAQSMAIGITPPSLAILRTVGLDGEFVRHGVTVRHASVWEQGRAVGHLTFADLPGDFRCILSLPQSQTVKLLREGAARFTSVTLTHGVEFAGLRPDAAGVNVRLNDLESGITAELRARFVVGCDGHRSAVRQALGIRVREKVYRQRWVMGDFTDATGLGDTAHLFFAPAASVESFPLPNHQRRWIVLRPPHDATEPAEYLVQQVRRLTGHDPGALAPGSVSCFGAKRMLADRYGVGRVWLAGDTAHVMSSIGGQGMNTGFADAAHAAQALMAVGDLAERLGGYETARKQAYRVAAGRAERGMYFGTARGRLMSRIRQVVIRDILFSRWCADRLAPYFAMLTIPNQPLLGEAV